jgi:hypothetical protein
MISALQADRLSPAIDVLTAASTGRAITCLAATGGVIMSAGAVLADKFVARGQGQHAAAEAGALADH